jgi:hypothetical protein
VDTPPVEVVFENNDDDTITTPSPSPYYPTYSPTTSYPPTPYPTIPTLSPTTYEYRYDIIHTALIKLYWEDSYKWTMGQPPNTIDVIVDPKYCMGMCSICYMCVVCDVYQLLFP